MAEPLTAAELAAIADRYFEQSSAEHWAEIIGRTRPTYLEHYDDAPDIVVRLLATVEAYRALLERYVARADFEIDDDLRMEAEALLARMHG